MSHHFWFWLMIAVVGFIYFRYGMPAFRKMGVSIDPHTVKKPEGQGK